MCPRLISLLLLHVSLSSCVSVNLYGTTIAKHLIKRLEKWNIKFPKSRYDDVGDVFLAEYDHGDNFRVLSAAVNCGGHIIVPKCKAKIELQSFLVKARLNDIAIVPAPATEKNNTHYYLNKPNGEVIKLDISDLRSDTLQFNEKVNDKIKLTNYAIVGLTNYKTFNVNRLKQGVNANDIFENNRKQMDPMDIMMGPFTEEDYGNWVLSAYFVDTKGDVVELFQVISVEIVDTVPAKFSFARLSQGGDFTPSFAYPIIYLETCELRPPKSASDRYYDRDRTRFNSCGYIVPNMTQHDEGVWTIVGVGKIVYEAKVYLKVDNKIL